MFISYAVYPDAATFQTVRTAFEALGLNVFNPDIHMSRLEIDGGASGELMQHHVRASKVVLVVLSRDGPIFKSPWCLMELKAAKEAGIPIIPIYNGDDSSLMDIKNHIDGKVAGLSPGSQIYEGLVKYIFKEQILELVSTQHASDVAQRLRKLAKRIQELPTPPPLPPLPPLVPKLDTQRARTRGWRGGYLPHPMALPSFRGGLPLRSHRSRGTSPSSSRTLAPASPAASSTSTNPAAVPQPQLVTALNLASARAKGRLLPKPMALPPFRKAGNLLLSSSRNCGQIDPRATTALRTTSVEQEAIKCTRARPQHPRRSRPVQYL